MLHCVDAMSSNNFLNRFLICSHHAPLKKSEQWVIIKFLAEMQKTATETFICYVKHMEMSSQELVHFDGTKDFQNVQRMNDLTIRYE
jgi:hypothetical protein